MPEFIHFKHCSVYVIYIIISQHILGDYMMELPNKLHVMVILVTLKVINTELSVGE